MLLTNYIKYKETLPMLYDPDDKIIQKNIIQTVCQYYDVTYEQIKSRCRVRQIVKARSMVSYLLNLKIEGITLSKIGVVIRRDHSSVVHEINTIKNFLTFEKQTINDLKNINKLLK